MKIKLKNVRLSFPVLFTPQKFQGQGEPAFSATFLIPKNHPQIAELKTLLSDVANAAWQARGVEILAQLTAQQRTCLIDGDGSEYDGFPGNIGIRARSKTRPATIDGGCAPVTEEQGVFYSGCYVTASLDVWAQDNKYGKRINCTLRWVQFSGHGDAFGGSAPASPDEFEPISGDDIPW